MILSCPNTYLTAMCSLCRLLNAAGNLIVLLDYKWWHRRKPDLRWPRRMLDKTAMSLVVWTYPSSIHDNVPRKTWESLLVDYLLS